MNPPSLNRLITGMSLHSTDRRTVLFSTDNSLTFSPSCIVDGDPSGPAAAGEELLRSEVKEVVVATRAISDAKACGLSASEAKRDVGVCSALGWRCASSSLCGCCCCCVVKIAWKSSSEKMARALRVSERCSYEAERWVSLHIAERG
jgi:hypothetical protein